MKNLLKTDFKEEKKLLSSKTDVPFILSFKYPLEKGYTFASLNTSDIKDFQRFLDKVSHMTADQVDKLFLRKSDKTDVYNDCQVIHYEVTQKFRIHGIIENARFKILRLDPNHRYHD